MMKLNIAKLLPALVLLLILGAACGLVVENDISKEKVLVLSPGDTTSFSKVNFIWEEIDDALYYNIQVASPGFDNLGQIVADTSITLTSHQQELVPGNYQWRVRAENEGYKTAYTVRNLVVGVDKDLTDQEVVLISPLNKTKTGDTTALEFSWSKLLAADYYRLQVYSSVGTSTNTIFDGDVFDNRKSLDLPGKNTTYNWKVRAVNDISSTKFSLEWSFDIDTTGLNQPVFRE